MDVPESVNLVFGDVGSWCSRGRGEERREMLRGMNKVQKDHCKGQLLSDSTSDSCFSSNGLIQKARNATLFSVPGLFVGFSAKGLSESDAVRSPTSPLDYKGFSNLGHSFLGFSRSASLDGKPRCWDGTRVGLRLVDTLNDETKPCGKLLGLSESSNILFAPRMRINISSPKPHLVGPGDDCTGAAPKSLPKDYRTSPQTGRSKGAESECGEVGLLRSCSVVVSTSSSTPIDSKSESEVFASDSKSSMAEGSANFDKLSGSLPVSIGGSPCGVIASLSASEIEQSEDYTCIISHGPNPKTTHIFGDCILESHSFPSRDLRKKHRKDEERSAWLLKPSEEGAPPCTSSDFLRCCFSCKKKLEEGKDIYMYRGEKAFCSCDCRDQEILMEEEMEEKPTFGSSGSSTSSFHEEIFLEDMTMAE
ncbi:FCS-Like Zinc finger 10-like isoform X1 [Musa acuminata AAA Group]|uniref:FCS-Like Zinc finger 10-like isoform X1 n=2 Tax=Musa acuminata AAA Group TaxID=214697 RepID=UPI0031D6D1D1